jgi:hypothetical protein
MLADQEAMRAVITMLYKKPRASGRLMSRRHQGRSEDAVAGVSDMRIGGRADAAFGEARRLQP